MKRLLTVLLLTLPLVIVACALPVVPTLGPTISPTLEQLPTETIKPTPRPSPAPPQIPVPYTVLTPTRVVTLTITEITGTISTRGKAAIVWLADGVRHFGILDVEKASVSQLPFSLEDNSKQSGDVVWSPTGAAFVYEQHIVYSVDGTLYDYDVFGIPLDASHNGARLDKGIHYFHECNWSPDGQYIICSFNATDRGTGGNCIRVYDFLGGNMVCGPRDQLFSENFGDRSLDCKPLLLTTGELWDPVTSDPYLRRLTITPVSTEATHDAIQIALTQFCWPSKSGLRCITSVSPNGRFITYGLWLNAPGRNDLFLDKEQSRVWKIGVGTQFWSWTVDSRYLSWIDNNQMYLFDTADDTATSYVLPDAKILNVTWSPL